MPSSEYTFVATVCVLIEDDKDDKDALAYINKSFSCRNWHNRFPIHNDELPKLTLVYPKTKPLLACTWED